MYFNGSILSKNNIFKIFSKLLKVFQVSQIKLKSNFNYYLRIQFVKKWIKLKPIKYKFHFVCTINTKIIRSKRDYNW